MTRQKQDLGNRDYNPNWEKALKPVFHLGATMGPRVQFWGSRDEFGNTSLIVAKPEEGRRWRALGPNWTVLMRRHGAAVSGRSLEELPFRTVYTARNVAMQIHAHGLGAVSPLTAEETELAAHYNLQPGPVNRAWEYWSMRLDKAEGTAPARKRAGAAGRARSKIKSRAKARRRRR